MKKQKIETNIEEPQQVVSENSEPTTAEPIAAAPAPGPDHAGGLEEVIENKNQVIPEAVEKAKETATEVLTDEDGKTFNPDLHIANPDGSPRINSQGFITKKRGRKKGCAPNGKLNLPDPHAGAVAAELQDATIKRQQAAYLSASGFINVGVLIFGEEWLPEKTPVDETGMIVQAFDDYYKIKGVADIPPGIALVIALGGYGIKRFAKPNTKTKMQLIVGSVIERVKNLFNRLRGRKVVNGAHSDSRNNPDGKNDTRGGTGAAQ